MADFRFEFDLGDIAADPEATGDEPAQDGAGVGLADFTFDFSGLPDAVGADGSHLTDGLGHFPHAGEEDEDEDGDEIDYGNYGDDGDDGDDGGDGDDGDADGLVFDFAPPGAAPYTGADFTFEDGDVPADLAGLAAGFSPSLSAGGIGGVGGGGVGFELPSFGLAEASPALSGGSGGELGEALTLEEESTATFEPLVHLEPVEVKTGEEEENVVYSHRSRLYRFGDGQWKERGTGDIKLLQHKSKRTVRAVLREDKTGHLRLNANVEPEVEMAHQQGSDRAWTWSTTDHSGEEPWIGTLAIKFRDAEAAGGFKEMWDRARDANQKAVSGQEVPTLGSPVDASVGFGDPNSFAFDITSSVVAASPVLSAQSGSVQASPMLAPEDADCTAHFEPLVTLSQVEVQTGEEGQQLVYEHRSRLYRFSEELSDWKERGTGDVKLLYDTEQGKTRIVLRQEKTGHLRLNHWITPNMELVAQAGSDRAWTWAATDFSNEEPWVGTMAIKFRNAQVAASFKAKWHEACQGRPSVSLAQPVVETKSAKVVQVGTTTVFTTGQISGTSSMGQARKATNPMEAVVTRAEEDQRNANALRSRLQRLEALLSALEDGTASTAVPAVSTTTELASGLASFGSDSTSSSRPPARTLVAGEDIDVVQDFKEFADNADRSSSALRLLADRISLMVVALEAAKTGRHRVVRVGSSPLPSEILALFQALAPGERAPPGSSVVLRVQGDSGTSELKRKLYKPNVVDGWISLFTGDTESKGAGAKQAKLTLYHCTHCGRASIPPTDVVQGFQADQRWLQVPTCCLGQIRLELGGFQSGEQYQACLSAATANTPESVVLQLHIQC